MTIEELQKVPEFVTLRTQNLKDFVVAFCTNGADKIAAARTAYPGTKTDEGLSVTADRTLRHPAVKRLIGDYFGQVDETGSRDEFLGILWKKVRDGSGTDDKTQLGWATLYMKVKGYETKPTSSTEPPEPEGEDWVKKLQAVKG